MRKNLKKNEKKEILWMLVALVSLAVITLGVSVAFFNYTKEGTTENTVTSGTITFLYTEVSGVGKGIQISDAYPMTDEQGKEQTGQGSYFDFKITSQTASNISIPYEVTARKSSDSTLDDQAVKLYLTEKEGETEKGILLNTYDELEDTKQVTATGYTEKVIYIGKVPANQSNYEKNFRLRMWIDEKTDFSGKEEETGNVTYPYNGKTFTLTVNVYSNGKVVTEEDESINNVNIKSIKVGNNYAVKVENEEYDYEVGVSDISSSSMVVEPENPYANVKIGVANEEEISKTSLLTTVQLADENNYYKIIVTSEDGKTSKEYKIHIHKNNYTEAILNQTDPVIKDSLIPVMVESDGTVRKVDNNYAWYHYEKKNWANAVILKDESKTNTYTSGQIIPEDAIESYFVWIPRYKYKIFNDGNYTGLTSFENKVQEIEIIFENKETGASSGTKANEYLTHPAFTSFDVNGIWVGKFETGYEGATQTSEAEQNSSDSNKIIIKPNVYSWRNITVGNAFLASYNYKRDELDSHMMKNTEWGAVAYLSHSKYGIEKEIRINNNSSYITGYTGTEAPTKGNSTTSIDGNRNESTELGEDKKYTVGYFSDNQAVNQLASTTGNKTGIYDMNGGAWEYVMGYTTTGGNHDKSGFQSSSYESKYYDTYSSTNITDYNKRILGDATGEMGPFASDKDPDQTSRPRSSWYKDYSGFVNSAAPWIDRGGGWYNGTSAGVFTFGSGTGEVFNSTSFRLVLALTD